jgi:aminodeoxyfutalosine synthase
MTLNESSLQRVGLSPIRKKILAGQRLDMADGEQLFACPDPTLVGQLAHEARTLRHGRRTSYVLNQQINYTNICQNRCLFCSYRREPGQDGAFQLSLTDILAKVEGAPASLSELHIVGGCHPELRLAFFEDLLTGIKASRPDVTLKCFTPVEIAHFARLEGISSQDVLRRLKRAGLDMLPGGGAEIFAPHVRQRICPAKIEASEWLAVCALAHQLEIPTNCTMLFGHLETEADRLEHLDRLRRQQDETGGFLCFIPLPFLTSNNQLSGVRRLSGIEELKTIAVSRLMLDNIPHVKSYWVMLGLKQAQAALYFGADDLDGTVVEEKIGHMAGADSPQVLSQPELEVMIRGCGLEPVQRNARFEPVDQKAGPSRDGI